MIKIKDGIEINGSLIQNSDVFGYNKRGLITVNSEHRITEVNLDNSILIAKESIRCLKLLKFIISILQIK